MDKKEDYTDFEQELNLAKEKIVELESELEKVKQVIVDNDLEDEIEGISLMSDSERICVKGISQILELVEKGVHQDSDVKNFDILYKNLRLIRGQEIPKGKKAKAAKSTNVAELISIVKAGSEK